MRNRGIRALLAGGAMVGTLMSPVTVRATTQAEEALMAVAATWANIFYVPAKTAVAMGSIPVGGMAGLFSGGDKRTAYAIWVPAMGGTWFLTNGHLDGSRQVEFFGADYEDTPTPNPRNEGSLIYEVPYRELYRPEPYR